MDVNVLAFFACIFLGAFFMLERSCVYNVFVDLYRYLEGPAFRRWPLALLAGPMYYGE